MSIRRRTEETSVKASWTLTYGCLMTQLLVFFVMLFALSAVTTVSQLKEIKERIDHYIEANNLESLIVTDLSKHARGLVISMADAFMFKSGEADLSNPEAIHHIGAIANIIRMNKEGHPYFNRMTIEGHTDNVPLRPGAKFPTNWELSTARATNISRYLVESENFQPERMSSSGYAEWKPAEINLKDFPEKERLKTPASELVHLANETPEKRARNRRVDIVVHRLELWEMDLWRKELLRSASRVIGRSTEK